MVTLLSMIGMPPMSGRVRDLSGGGLQLILPNPVPCGSPVKVESEHLVVLGEVCRCEPDQNEYLAGLRVLSISTVANKPSRAIMEV